MQTLSFSVEARDSATGRPVFALGVTVDGVDARETANALRSARVPQADAHVLRFSRAGYLPFTWKGDPAPGCRLIVRLCPSTLRVVAFGDSITAGLDVASNERYSSKLAPLLERQNPGLRVDVLERGRVGDTYVSALSRLQSDVLSVDPDVTIVELGTNDALRTPLSDFASTMRAVLDPLTRACRTVLVADIPYKPRWYGTWNQQAAPFDQQIRQTAEQVQTLPVLLSERFRRAAEAGRWDLFSHADPYDFTAPDSVYQGDFHPNAAGHELMAEAFADAITQAIAPGVSTASIGPRGPIFVQNDPFLSTAREL